MRVLDCWTNATTGVMFPRGCRLTIGCPAMSVDLDPVQRDAEFWDSNYVPAAYWEGAVSVARQKARQAISEVAFVELVGYDPGQQMRSPFPSPGR